MYHALAALDPPLAPVCPSLLAQAVATSTDLAEAGPSKTLNLQLLGADRAKIVVNQSFDRIVVTLRESYELDKDVAKHLVHNYGM